MKDSIIELIRTFDFKGFLDIFEHKYIEHKYKSFVEEFLQTFWEPDTTISNLMNCYNIKKERIKQLLFPIPFNFKESCCPNCIESNEFYIKKGFIDSEYTVYCLHCKNEVNQLLTLEEAIKIKETRVAFDLEVKKIEDKLDEVKCPKCQSEMIILSNNIFRTYEIMCSKCDVKYDEYSQLEKDYIAWKKLAAMMIKIKATEEERIEKLLDKKNINDIKIKTEEIITIYVMMEKRRVDFLFA